MKSSSYYRKNRKFGKKSSEILKDFIFQLIIGLLIYFICLWLYEIYDSCDFLKDIVEFLKEREQNLQNERWERILEG